MGVNKYLDLFRDEVEVVDKRLDFNEVTPYLKREKPYIFENVLGKKGFGNLWNSRERIAKALKVEKGELTLKFLDAIENPISCKKIKNAPIFENELENFDLREFPIPKYFKNDGGRYLTSGLVISNFDGVKNMSFHRMMVLGKKKFAVRLVPRHLYAMHKKALQKKQDLKIAIAVGVCPSILLAGGVSTYFGVFELEIASSLRKKTLGERVEVVEIDSIEVPAHSEYVFLGRITSKTVPEGPFVDVTGTYDKVREQPVVEVDKVFHRNNAMMHFLMPGGLEHYLLMGMPREPMIYKTVSQVVPEVTGVRLTEGGCCWLHGVVGIKWQKKGDSKNAILAAFTGHPSMKKVIVVDDDIDVFDDRQVEWAVATRFQAHKDLVLIKNARGSSLDPSANDTTSKIGIDATATGEKFRRVLE